MIYATRRCRHDRDRKAFHPWAITGRALAKGIPVRGKEVRVSKVGDRVILEPIDSNGAMPWALIDQTGDSPFMPDGREQPEMPTDRAAFER
jgi:antitoxin VapB